LINPAAEKLTVVDEEGEPIGQPVIALIVTDIFLRTHSARRIAVPVGSSMGVEEIAVNYGVEVMRVRNNHLAMMEAFQRGGVDYVGGTRGGFLFPGFHSGTDAVLAAVFILEMMAKLNVRLGDLRHQFEKYIRREMKIPVPGRKRARSCANLSPTLMTKTAS